MGLKDLKNQKGLGEVVRNEGGRGRVWGATADSINDLLCGRQ